MIYPPKDPWDRRKTFGTLNHQRIRMMMAQLGNRTWVRLYLRSPQ